MVNMNIYKRWEGYENKVAMRSDRIINDPQHHNLGVGLEQLKKEMRLTPIDCFAKRIVRMNENHPVQCHELRHSIWRRKNAEYDM